MSLVADYSSSSGSLTDSDNSSDYQLDEKIESNKLKLPSANQLLTLSSSKSAGTVLNNPFHEAENAKIAVLEKHVKMVNKDEHLREKNGRKICWNYRKGRCRFSSKCSYAHDSDLSTDPERAAAHQILGDVESSADISISQDSGQQASYFGSNSKDKVANKLSSSTANEKKHKRPGLGDSVEPSKKVLTLYMQGKLK